MFNYADTLYSNEYITNRQVDFDDEDIDPMYVYNEKQAKRESKLANNNYNGFREEPVYVSVANQPIKNNNLHSTHKNIVFDRFNYELMEGFQPVPKSMDLLGKLDVYQDKIMRLNGNLDMINSPMLSPLVSSIQNVGNKFVKEIQSLQDKIDFDFEFTMNGEIKHLMDNIDLSANNITNYLTMAASSISDYMKGTIETSELGKRVRTFIKSARDNIKIMTENKGLIVSTIENTSDSIKSIADDFGELVGGLSCQAWILILLAFVVTLVVIRYFWKKGSQADRPIILAAPPQQTGIPGINTAMSSDNAMTTMSGDFIE